MTTQQLSSFETVRRLYTHHFLRRIAILLLFVVGYGVLGAHIVYTAKFVFSFSATAINGLFVVLVLVLGVLLWRYITHWVREGIGLGPFYHRWEKSHPELANRISLVVYANRNPEEIERLGYSHDLLHVEDEWVKDYAGRFSGRDQRIVPWPYLVVFLLIVTPTLLVGVLQYATLSEQYRQIVGELYIRDIDRDAFRLRVEGETSALRGEPVLLQARLEGRTQATAGHIHLSSPSGWQTFSAEVDGGWMRYRIPALYRSVDYYFSLGTGVSNRGALQPLDPPTVTGGEVVVTPPEYIEQAAYTAPLGPFSVPAGSRVDAGFDISTPLQAASLRYNDTELPIEMSGREVRSSFSLMASGECILAMTDEHGFYAESMRYPVTVIPDATPSIEIMAPGPVTDVPMSFIQRVQVHARDDHRVTRVYVHTYVNDKPEEEKTGLIWAYSEEAAATLHGATDIYLSYDWDLTQFELYPGDALSYSLEVWDNDAIEGNKSARTQTYRIQYPTLVDLLSLLDEMEEEQVKELSDLVEEQKNIRKDAEKTIEDITEKLDATSGGEEGEEALWLEKQELESIKKRQEDLAEQAKQLEEKLEAYQENAQQELSPEEQEEQGFTPETLEKIDRIQDLLEELVDKDSQQLIEKIEQTIEQMSQEMTADSLQDLQFSFEDYEAQLDRTLSMLEKTFESRQLEGLRKMSEALAEQQEHLSRETEALAKEKERLDQAAQALEQKKAEGEPDAAAEEALANEREELQQKQDALKERQERIEDDTQAMMERMEEMQQALQDENPMMSEMIKQMSEQLQEQGLQQEMKRSSQQLAQNQPSSAVPHQKKAQAMLQQMSEQLQEQMNSMGQQNMDKDTQAIRRLADRGLFLSHRMESLTESAVGQGSDSVALQHARVYLREMERINQVWAELAQGNPFMGRSVQQLLRDSRDRLAYGLDAGQGTTWVGLHETRQSMIALNAAIFEMLQDMQQMQQQMQQQMGMQSMQQQMQQLLSQQQSLSEMLEQMREMGEEGEAMMQRMREMARQQAQVRKEIEKMMRQYRHAKQIRQQLEGIYQEMDEVEQLLEQGVNDERVGEKQKRILSRMLEAGTFQEKDEFGKERKAETATRDRVSEKPNEKVPLQLKDRIQRASEQPVDEKIPSQYREAIKNHFIRLSEKMAQ